MAKAFMSILSRWISAVGIIPFGIILAIHPSAFAQSAATPVAPPAWPVTSSPARFIVDLDNHDSPPSAMSWVSLYLPDPKWETMPIRVFTDTGIAVGSDLLWTSPGEPATLLFDSSSGAKHYQVYMGSNWPPMHLANAKSGVVLESRESDGRIINSLPDMFQAWNQSSNKVLGRAIVTSIFEGGNRFGPQGNLLEHFQGWFDVAAQEYLQLAVISVDATFVLIDGKEVVEWPGVHHFGPGLGGQPPGDGLDVGRRPQILGGGDAYVHAQQRPGDE